MRWEGEGIRTRRLEEALRADTPPDVDRLVDGFARDAARLLDIRAALGSHPRGRTLNDPDDLQTAESLLHAVPARTASVADFLPPESDETESPDPWFFDPLRAALQWTGVDERLVEAPR